MEILPQVRTKEGDYKFPPVSLLEKGKKTAGNNKEELRQTAQKLQKTLEDFGVHVTITNISCGPSVTQFELHPEQGVKVSKIVNLADDIKLILQQQIFELKHRFQVNQQLESKFRIRQTRW